MTRFLVVTLALLLAGAPAAAAPSPSPAAGQLMEISAQRTVYDGKAHTYTVTGKVRIAVPPQLVVTCEQATVYADASEHQIVKVVFTGNVEAKRGDDTFHASKITLLVPERRLVAEGTTHTRLKLPAGGPVAGP